MAHDHSVLRGTGERGETLIESMVAITILFIVVLATSAGLRTVLVVSADQRMSARSETLLRSAAEQLQNPEFLYIPRASCDGAGGYAIPPLSTTEAGYDVTVDSVSFWSGAAGTPSATVGASFATACPSSTSADRGLQRIVLNATSPNGKTNTLTIMKRRS